jgi:hypothetical protein
VAVANLTFYPKSAQIFAKGKGQKIKVKKLKSAEI